MRIKTNWNLYIKDLKEKPLYAECIIERKGEEYPEDALYSFNPKDKEYSSSVEEFIKFIKKSKSEFTLIDCYFKGE